MFINSIISSFIELIITHPIDYYKNLHQNNITKPFHIIKKNPFLGIKPKLYGMIPMRIVFWNTLYILENKKTNPFIIPIITATTQTIIDYPLEQIKFNTIFNSKPTNIYKAISTHYIRNIIFSYNFFFFTHININPWIGGALGGIFGSITSQPFDSLKTYYQSGNFQTPKWNTTQYFKGTLPRTFICLISSCVGNGVIKFLS